MKYYILLLSFVLSFGCKPKEEHQSDFEPTAKEIAQALNMKVWKVQVPEDLPEGKTLALRLSFQDRDTVLARLGADRGEIYKLIMWPTDDGKQIHLYTDTKFAIKTGVMECNLFSFSRSYENLDTVCNIGDTLFVTDERRVYVGEADELM